MNTKMFVPLIFSLCFFCVPPEAQAVNPPINLTGTVRDFSYLAPNAHPDFEINPIPGVDLGIVQSTLGVDGKPVYAGGAGTPSTHGSTAFNQWYNDTSGINLSAPLTLTLTDIGGGLYGYQNNAFFPIDNALFGNQGNPHNYHFTLELHSQFQYDGGEIFNITADDDLWIFINDKLIVDLGGVHPPLSASINLDAIAASIGLSVGGIYNFDLFFAERHTTESNLQFQTDIALASVPEPATYLALGSLLLSSFFLLQKRRLAKVYAKK